MFQEVSSNINNNGYMRSSNQSNATFKISSSNNSNNDNKKQQTTSQMEHYYRFIEMSEIFFNCTINSNPDSHLIEWFMNEKLIHTDIPKEIVKIY
ncbi:hypothetical protein BLA29_008073 [Euroglyphus maynei]|uniref:Ig-like domain-containing protein n=1 Tax=Euroglyphus maynei TaxID=6958 RepID=A0A1Y3AWN0_EURMA|nr:hypothetical protein BLA29_008073 [Euroglyphus maynei]